MQHWLYDLNNIALFFLDFYTFKLMWFWREHCSFYANHLMILRFYMHLSKKALSTEFSLRKYCLHKNRVNHINSFPVTDLLF
jgi:hypothetical protein